MKYNFLGFHNWPARSGQLDMLQAFDVFRASESSQLPRDVCAGCVCWREHGTCVQVQVDDWEEDALLRSGWDADAYKGITDCLVCRNCCPILFFDFIGVKLPELEAAETD